MTTFALESRDFAETASDDVAILRACPFVIQEPGTDDSFTIAGEYPLEYNEGDTGSFRVYAGVEALEPGEDFERAYRQVKRLYDWLCAMTPFDWELYAAAATEDFPCRFRPSTSYPETLLEYEDDDPLVIDVSAAPDDAVMVFLNSA